MFDSKIFGFGTVRAGRKFLVSVRYGKCFWYRRDGTVRDLKISSGTGSGYLFQRMLMSGKYIANSRNCMYVSLELENVWKKVRLLILLMINDDREESTKD